MALLQVNTRSSEQPQFWRRHFEWATIYGAAAFAVLASIPFIFGTPLPQIHIEWRDISDGDRTIIERRFALTEPRRLGGNVWSYVPTDTSRDRLFAIVSEPAVADTNGINRRTFSISDTPPLTDRRGGLLGAPAWAARATRLVGYALVLISALFLIRAAVALPALRQSLHAQGSIGRSLAGLFAFLRSKARKAQVPPSVVAAAVVGFAATLAWRFMTFTGFTNDHYVHLALAQQMLMGDRPIRDFADSGWPLMYLLSAAAWRLAGDALVTEWAIAALGFAVGAACTIVAAYQLSGSLIIAVTVTLLEVLIYPRTYSYPKVLVYAVAACAMVALARRPSHPRIVLTSLIVAISFLFRHDHGLFVGVAAAVTLATASRAGGWRSAFTRTALLTAATAVFLLPWIVFVSLNGGLVAYFQGGLEYSRAEAGATSLAALPMLDVSSPVSTIANAEAWLFWLFWGAVAACTAVLLARVLQRRERWTGESAAVAGLVTVAVLVNASFLRQALQVRLPDAIVPSAVLAAWSLGLCWMGQWSRRGVQVTVQFATIIVLSVSIAAISRITDLPGQYDESDIGRGPARLVEHGREVAGLLGSHHRDNLSPPSRVSRALMPFVAYLDRCTSTSDRLIVTGEFPEVLVIAGRRFAGDGVVFGSWYASETRQDRTVDQLRADPPLFVLHTGDYDGFRGRFGLVEAFVSGAYEPMTEIAVEGTDSVRILVHRDRKPTRTDSETDWPCFR